MERIDPESIETHSRRARLALLCRDVASARDQLNAALAAAKELIPSAPETVAWCEVQLGELAFNRGNWDDAERSYKEALEAFPNYYGAIDHLGELRAAREDYAGALALYQPLAAYLKSVEQGEVHYFHHLASFFSDVREDPAAATRDARQDLELRHTAAAHEALAWALYRVGEFEKSVAELKLALSSGDRSAHLFYHPAMISSAAGDLEQGQRYLRETLVLNPRYNAFHVHR